MSRVTPPTGPFCSFLWSTDRSSSAACHLDVVLKVPPPPGLTTGDLGGLPSPDNSHSKHSFLTHGVMLVNFFKTQISASSTSEMACADRMSLMPSRSTAVAGWGPTSSFLFPIRWGGVLLGTQENPTFRTEQARARTLVSPRRV